MQIPKEIRLALNTLTENKFQAFAVGGCVRDILRKKKPKDWDLTTNAFPEQIQECFEKKGSKTFYENKFGTVSVLTDSEDETLKTLEITPFRTESQYSDKRHPDQVKWAETIQDDLSRRDFTCNSIALTTENEKLKIIDLCNGQKDIKNKIIRAVGKPQERFAEDGLRMIRAVRFAVSLDAKESWTIEPETAKGIKENANLLAKIAQERIRDEFIKIIQSRNSAQGIELLLHLGLLTYIIPELEAGIGVDQNKHHTLQVFQHNLLSLKYASEQDFSFEVRMAALLHDIAKPQTKRGQGQNATFYGHEIVGSRIAGKILQRLRFPKKQTEKIVKLIACHLFYYNVGEVTEASVRRLLRKMGPENIEELLQLRYADRIGSGVPKAEPYKLRHLKYLFEKVSKDPISVKTLKVNGSDIIRVLSLKPCPKVGHILSYLLSYVLSYPEKNKKEVLTKRINELGRLSDKELEKLTQQAKKEINEIVQKQDTMTKQKYWVS